MANDEETVREVYESCKSVEVWDLPDMPMDFARRFLAAHEREMAAMVAAHQQWRQNFQERLAEKDEMARISAQSAQARFDEEMAEKDAEIARLKAALKPVLELDMRRFGFAVGYGECFEAVREAQRIMKEGEAK